jgi:hypothetical protein
MTGELCDCFASKREGVLHILDAVCRVAGSRPVHVWTTEGRFLDADEARSAPPLRIAASNWLALASWAGRLTPEGSALLLDIGSTTSDLIPLVAGRPIPCGRTDPERLRTGELVYTGARRTPVCALVGTQVAAELFATTLDVYLVLGDLAPDPEDTSTADGRPATPEHAHARLARMLGADLESSTEAERLALAYDAAERQLARLVEAAEQQLAGLAGPVRTTILAGSGEFLARKVVASVPALAASRVWSLSEHLGSSLSTAACAYAAAVLCSEQRGATA